jgi:hypothetical protein
VKAGAPGGLDGKRVDGARGLPRPPPPPVVAGAGGAPAPAPARGRRLPARFARGREPAVTAIGAAPRISLSH